MHAGCNILRIPPRSLLKIPLGAFETFMTELRLPAIPTFTNLKSRQTSFRAFEYGALSVEPVCRFLPSVRVLPSIASFLWPSVRPFLFPVPTLDRGR